MERVKEAAGYRKGTHDRKGRRNFAEGCVRRKKC